MSQAVKLLPYQGYGATEDGRIWSLWTPRHRVQGKEWREIHGQTNRAGYCQMTISVNGRKLRILAHRLVAMAFLPSPQDGQEINHIDFDRKNNCAANLEWVSRVENVRHSAKAGRLKWPIGENHPKAKLTAKEVAEIRSCGGTSAEVAPRFGVCESTIRHIRNGRGWKIACPTTSTQTQEAAQ